jgi:hypothetical protein
MQDVVNLKDVLLVIIIVIIGPNNAQLVCR